MSRHLARTQPDLFTAPEADLFGDQPGSPAERRSYAPDPAEVRAHLAEIVGCARQADTMPWDDRKLRFYKTVVPQMTRWLPEGKSARWISDFQREIARLEAA